MKKAKVTFKSFGNPLIHVSLTREYAFDPRIMNLEDVEAFANVTAAQMSATDRVSYYVATVVVDCNNFVCNPEPSYYSDKIAEAI